MTKLLKSTSLILAVFIGCNLGSAFADKRSRKHYGPKGVPRSMAPAGCVGTLLNSSLTSGGSNVWQYSWTIQCKGSSGITTCPFTSFYEVDYFDMNTRTWVKYITQWGDTKQISCGSTITVNETFWGNNLPVGYYRIIWDLSYGGPPPDWLGPVEDTQEQYFYSYNGAYLQDERPR